MMAFTTSAVFGSGRPDVPGFYGHQHTQQSVAVEFPMVLLRLLGAAITSWALAP